MELMSRKLRFLRWLENKAVCAQHRCWEERLKSQYVADIEDGLAICGEYDSRFWRLVAIYGVHSQDIRNLRSLVRLQSFKIGVREKRKADGTD